MNEKRKYFYLFLRVLVILVTVLWFYSCSTTRNSEPNLISIVSSNEKLNTAFEWAKDKSLSYVLTGKQGVVNKSENSDGERNVNYVPCYWAGYPFRTAFYSRDYCHQMAGAHLLGLERENFNMLKLFAASASASKKWYPLWAINFDGSPYSLDYVNDSSFVREVPAVFELVEKAYKQYLWTGNKELINDNVLWKYYTKVLTEFIALHDNFRPNGVAEGSGTGNIFAGVATYNESEVPLSEAGDGIACQYQALISYSKMLEIKGLSADAKQFASKANELKSFFNTSWGKTAKSENYVRGYTNLNEPQTDFGKESSWFIPLKYLPESSAENLNYLKFISNSLADPNKVPKNIEALTYLPDLYFAYNQIDDGWFWMKKIIDSQNDNMGLKEGGSNGDYPELAFTLISGVVENLMGIEPNAHNHSVSTISRLPDEISFLAVNNLVIGKHRLDIRHERQTKTVINHTEGDTDMLCNIRFYGKYNQVKVNGTVFMAKHEVLNGSAISSIQISIPASETISAEVMD